jgi:nucleotide-binding universal stress UspA family protein
MASSSLAVEAIFLCVNPGVLLDPLFAEGYTMPSIQKLEDEQRKQQDDTLNAAIRRATPLGIKLGEVVCGNGSITKEILRIADEKNCDQIAMGTRGMGALGSLFLGSVAQGVVHHAKVPVLLVK